MDIDCPNSLKRCSSAPMINNILLPNTAGPHQMAASTTQQQTNSAMVRETVPPTIFNILGPRARRHSGSFSPMMGGVIATGNGSPGGPRLTPRVSQLRQEECADISNSREVNHEREIHSALQISQSCEDLTIGAENWSCKSDDGMTNPLHVSLPNGPPICSSPSPTRNARYLYGLSPSPTRKTFQTRRSMSPIPLRPSSLSGVKRKCEMDDCGYSHSPPPFKKAFTERGPSPSICQTPSPICPSPDSYEGRTTPKLFPSKLHNYTTILNTSSFSSVCSSPLAPSMMEVTVDLSSAPVPNQLDTVLEHDMNDVDDDDDDDIDKIKQNNNLTEIKNEFCSVTRSDNDDVNQNDYSSDKLGGDNKRRCNNNNNDDTLLSVITSSSTSSPTPSPAATFESSDNSSNVSLSQQSDIMENTTKNKNNNNTNNLNMSVISTV